MTTLKEYKEMMECATKGPWSLDEYMAGIEKDYKSCAIMCPKNDQVICEIPDYCFYKNEEVNNKSNAQFIAASRNIAPDLIRVIELAEDVLKIFSDDEYYGLGLADIEKANEALAEIKKLKGE